eukprot:1849-Heterococcus_DN1.PRE.3
MFQITALAVDTPLLKRGSMQITPPPVYDTDKHQVMAYVQAKYGVHAWELPSMRVPVRQAVASSSSSSSSSDSGVELELRWFARLLLEGKAALISSTGTAFALQFAHSFIKQTANDAKAVDTRTVVTIADVSCVPMNALTPH